MVNLTFVGDISFNDAGKEIELDLSDFLAINSKTDFTVANLEALAGIGEANLLKKPRVTTNEQSLEKLTQLGINLVTLGHNHVYDAKLSGFVTTIKKLKKLNISFIGAGLTKAEAEKPFILEHNNHQIGFLNYCSKDTNPNLPEDCELFLNVYDPHKMIEDIQNLKKRCHQIVLLLHWGGIFEGGYYPDEYQISDSEKFVKAGASLIVGHHSHTLQPNIILDKIPVYFSLGNFIFFDIKHGDKLIKLSSRRKIGGILKVSLSHSEIIKHKLYFSLFSGNKINIKNSNLKHKLRNFFFRKLKTKTDFWRLYNMQFKYINPLFYFLFVQEGGHRKFQKLNLNKIKRYLWKK